MKETLSNPLISIIVPVYNVAQYLQECIDSIMNQTYTNLEIILVDDGSTDGSSQICDEYALKEKRIKVIHKTNGGLVSARKAGILAASGDYIGYVDGDDWIDSDMYKQMYESGAKYNVDIVAVENIREFADGTGQIEHIYLREGIYQHKEVVNEIIPNLININIFFQWNIPLHVWRHLIRRELVVQNQMLVDNQIRMGEDVACILPCYLEASTVSIIHSTLYHYRQNDKSMKYMPSEEDRKGLKYLYERLKKAAEPYQIKKSQIHIEIRYIMFYLILWSAYELCIEQDSEELFPFQVRSGLRIALVGAGPFGKKVYYKVKENHICDIALWTDSRWEMYSKRGLPVEDINKLLSISCDYIVITVLSAYAQSQIIDMLMGVGIPSDKIRCCSHEAMTEDKLDELMKKIR